MRSVRCPRCGKTKAASEFYRKLERRHAWCKPCFNAYCVQRWIERKAKFVALLGGRCADCRRRFHPAVFDFHHLRDKDVGWNKLRLRSEKAIRAELAKCTLLCSNCHRLRHWAAA